MKIIITQYQYNLLINEQQTPPPGTGAAGLSPTTDKGGVTGVKGDRGEGGYESIKMGWGKSDIYRAPPGPVEEFYKENKHIILPIIEIGAAILIPPPAGLVIAAGIGMLDAAEYLKDGDKQMAGLAAIFAILPFVGKIPGVKQLSAKALKTLSQKLTGVLKEPLSAIEKEVVGALGNPKNKKWLEQVMTTQVGQLTDKALKGGKIAAEYIKPVTKFVSNLATGAAPYLGVAAAYNAGYDKAAEGGVLGNEEYIKKLGYTWKNLQTLFGPTQNEDDKNKIIGALKSGWRMGKIIPQQYRTDYYDKLLKQTEEKYEKGKELLASLNLKK